MLRLLGHGQETLEKSSLLVIFLQQQNFKSILIDNVGKLQLFTNSLLLSQDHDFI